MSEHEHLGDGGDDIDPEMQIGRAMSEPDPKPNSKPIDQKDREPMSEAKTTQAKDDETPTKEKLLDEHRISSLLMVRARGQMKSHQEDMDKFSKQLRDWYGVTDV